MYENYSTKIIRILQKKSIAIGQRISVIKGKESFEGLLMPKSSGDPNSLVIKLDNGYNVGIDISGAR